MKVKVGKIYNIRMLHNTNGANNPLTGNRIKNGEILHVKVKRSSSCDSTNGFDYYMYVLGLPSYNCVRFNDIEFVSEYKIFSVYALFSLANSMKNSFIRSCNG